MHMRNLLTGYNGLTRNSNLTEKHAIVIERECRIEKTVINTDNKREG